METRTSRRIVAVHPRLTELGFMSFVGARRSAGGPEAPLFPKLYKGPEGDHAAQWSKWFGRYIRQIEVPKAVFHSFRHGFKDALRNVGVSEDINDALMGQAGSSSVGRRYGAKDMVRRFGLERLVEAVEKVSYPGLDLSHVGEEAP